MIGRQILPIEKISLCLMLFYNKENYCYGKKDKALQWERKTHKKKSIV